MSNINSIDKNLNEATNLFQLGNYHEAIDLLKSLEKENENFLINWYLGHSLFKLHLYDEAILEVKKSISLNTEDSLNLNFLGEIFLEKNEYNEALNCFEKALILDNSNVNTIKNLIKSNLIIGNIKKSEQYLAQLLEKNPQNYGYLYSLIRINAKYLTENEYKKIQNNSNDLNSYNKIYSKLILAKKNQIDENYKSEIENLNYAHSQYERNNLKATKQQFNFYRNLLPKFIARFQNSDPIAEDKLNPIFILGLPRSGTTLIERVIFSEKNSIQSLGETDVLDKIFFSNKIIKNYNSDELLTDFKFDISSIMDLKSKIINQYISQSLSKNASIFTDKSISNFLYLELLNKIFPNAKFVYCFRNPLANLIGLYRAFLPNIFWSHSLDMVCKIFDQYYKKLEIVKKNKLNNFYVVNLEEFTHDPHLVSKNIYDFLDLKWSPEVLNVNNNFKVKTNSDLQVRKEIKKHNLDYTLNYKKIFKDLGFEYDWLTNSI